jgi:hypothetical protein
MKKLLLSSLLALFFGCVTYGHDDDPCRSESVGNELVYYADPAVFSREQFDRLETAAYEWNCFAKQQQTVTSVKRITNRTILLVDLKDSPCVTVEKDGVVYPVSGCAIGTEIYLNRWQMVNLDTFEAVSKHEMGHMLDLRHLPDGQCGVMSASVCTRDLTKEDMAWCQLSEVCN